HEVVAGVFVKLFRERLAICPRKRGKKAASRGGQRRDRKRAIDYVSADGCCVRIKRSDRNRAEILQRNAKDTYLLPSRLERLVADESIRTHCSGNDLDPPRIICREVWKEVNEAIGAGDPTAAIK